MGAASRSTSCIRSDEVLPVVMRELSKIGDSVDHSLVVETLASRSFFPYPPCPRQLLEQVDFYLVACDTSATARLSDLSSLPSAHSSGSEVVDYGVSMVGAIGVVWVPLSPGPFVEGYVQVVLVQPEFRRRRIARRMLERLMHRKNGGADNTKPIVRWRLHTMLLTAATKIYIRSFVFNEQPNPTGVVHTSFAKSDGVSGTQLSLEETEQLVAAVPRMYEELGFTTRRYVYAYYAGKADAVEMVYLVSGSQKGH
ncbi:hypothetical protein ERJ75_000720500 [Trypanosoma vivax]|uniref:N-acetyltransferase domain-containing protein n=1 Tax=Trypanosoma vivax (strain Y486) TaxID=1055687 RepID=G0TWU5_TRYVY|nr:hypothetical protein ERJ75_000720500 [Trypanosoma vivax]CCC48433.1 conserved hypothetical protein [Trypanosoma vivax Y486]